MRRASGWCRAGAVGLVALASALLPASAGATDAVGATGTGAAGATGAGAAIATAGGRVGACGAWTIVPGANHGADSTSLSSVAAAAPDDVWAVGSWTADGVTFHPMIERWEGSSWAAVPDGSGGAGGRALTGVTVAGPHDAWAVGLRVGTSTFRTFAERWDGSAWSVVPTPNSGTGENVLTAVTAVARDDVWAVGYHAASSGSPRRTLVEHWNGSRWSVVPSPNAGSGESFLWSVDAVSPANVWAVGQHDRQIGIASLIEHWNGSAWSVVPSPMATEEDILQGVSAFGASSVVAVGRGLGTNDRITALAEAYDGSAWSLTPIPNGSPELNWLFSVTASSGGDAWAVGERRDGLGMPYRTLIEHRDGRGWHVVNAPNQTSQDNVLSSVARVPGTTELWAVGSFLRGGAGRALIEHRC
jgi:hypothetical protein